MDEYSQLIMDKLISNYEFNYSEIALSLAKIDPKLFCRLAKISEEVGNNPIFSSLSSNNYYNLIDPYIKGGQYIQAIKELRSKTSWGLKESKDYCDERRYQLGLSTNGTPINTTSSW